MKQSKKLTLLATLLTTWGLALLGSHGASAETLDPRAHIQKATDLISAGQPSLARTYLGPALIAPQLHSTERSKAYYLRGYSYQVQNLKISALRDFHRALEFNPENTMAQVSLGAVYYYGEGTKPNYDLAFAMFTSAAENEHPTAYFHLGLANLYGKGVPKDVDSARQWLTKAADLDYAPAMEHLAHSYRQRQSETPEPLVAKQWYDKAITAGSDNAKIALAYMYAKGELGKNDAAKAVAMLTEAADAGSQSAQIALSQYYLTGEGVKENPAKALALLTEASANGSAQADFRIGFLHQTGQGTKRDADKARAYYSKAANSGVRLAQKHLALMLVQSSSADDNAEGVHWLQRAATSAEPQALNDLAWVLATSKHNQLRDGESALRHAQQAVEGVTAQEGDDASLPSYLDTLAAAYAELGRFEEAVDAQTQALAALALAEQQSASGEVLQELNRHLDAYKNRQPWRE